MNKQRVVIVFCAVVGVICVLAWLLEANIIEKGLSVDVSDTVKQDAEVIVKEVTELIIDDYEDGDLKNFLGGESGTWNLTPDDPEVDVYSATEVHEGIGSVLRLEYDVETTELASVGLWTKLFGLNAREFDHLAFEVRGDEEAGFTNVFLIEIKKYKNEKRIDKIKGTRVVTGVTEQWQTVEIPLNLFTGLFDQTNPKIWKDPMLARENLDELVINLESRRVSQKVGVLYFDNLRLIKTGNPGLHIIDQPTQKEMKTTVRLEGVDYMEFLATRLGGFPDKLLVNKAFPEDDREFLMTLARDTWRFFDEIVDQENSLPLDTIKMGTEEPIGEGGFIGDYTNVTNIGLYLMALVSGYDLGFISREETIQRIQNTLTSIEKMEHHESGFLYNYYDTTTLERTSYFVSQVDSGWLDAGVYVVKNAFPEELAEQCGRILSGHDFGFFYDNVSQQMVHGHFSHLNVRSDYVYGSFYTEPRATSYIAIGRGEVPLEHWFHLVRTFPEEYPWQTQMPSHRVKRETLGVSYYGGYYEWNGIPFVPSWGGSMFEALMPTLVIDEGQHAPAGLGQNNVNYVDVHVRYTLEELRYPVWGMSPSSVPGGSYSEYGVSVLGAKGYKAGVVTPHAAVLALEQAPEKTILNLRELIRRYPIYGEYGFYDAVEVETGRVARKYLALDQGMILISLNNYLNDGAIRKRFHADPINQIALPLLTEEKLFEQDKASAA
jgi:hypothetical protein